MKVNCAIDNVLDDDKENKYFYSLIEKVRNRVQEPLSLWTLPISLFAIRVIQTGLPGLVELASLSHCLVLRMGSENGVHDLPKHATVRKGTLGHFANGPQQALPAVSAPSIPDSFQRVVHELP